MKKRIISLLLVAVMLIGVLPVSIFAAAPAADAKVTLTVNNQGVLAAAKDGSVMAYREVTVKDLDADGKLTYHEALASAHEAYLTADAYVATESTWGLQVTKLWGIASTNTLYFKNNNALQVGVDNETVKEGDNLYISVNKDNTYYSDMYTYFSSNSQQVVLGNAADLYVWCNLTEGNARTEGVQLGLWKNGEFIALANTVTDKTGYAQITFTECGRYYVTAYGTVKDTVPDYTATPDENWVYPTIEHARPLMAPVCVVDVVPSPKFGSVEAYLTESDYLKGKDPLTLTPVFDKDTYSYGVTLPDYRSSVYIVAAKDQQTIDSGYNGYGMLSNSYGGASSAGWSADGYLKGYASISAQNVFATYISGGKRYEFNAARYATLKALTIDGVMSKDFDPDTLTYTAYVDGTKAETTLTVTGFKSTYTIKVNGKEITNGEAYTLTYAWDANGKMEVKIEVSAQDITTSTYTLNLEKKPLKDAPAILKESAGTEFIYTVIDKVNQVVDLFVEASANGELSYQWYYNTTDSTENGTKIENATASTFKPPITEDAVGTRYYYCVVTNTGKTTGNVAKSTPVNVTVHPDPTPVAIIAPAGTAMPDDGYKYAWDTGFVYTPGQAATALTVTATSAAPGGEFTYQWVKPSTPYNPRGWSGIFGDAARTDTYTPDTALTNANDNGLYYGCRVTYTFNGKKYTVWAKTGATYTDGEGESAKTYDVNGVYVFIKVDNAATPEITKQPVGGSYVQGGKVTALSVSASRADGGKLTYQWYENTTAGNQGGTAIEGATAMNLSVSNTEPSNKYYYCVVTNTLQGKTATATSEAVNVTIKSVAEIVDGRLEGKGTEEEPYLIKDAQDYQDVADIVAAGVSFKGCYFKQMADVTLPEGWQGIGCLKDPSINHINAGNNLNAFSGILDGNNKTVTVPEGGLPLLGYVNGATVKNLNIYGKKIAGYGLVDHLEGVNLSGEAILIDNVTLKSGSSTLKSGLIGTYITNNGFAGCSAAFYVTIKNCTIEKDVVIGYDKDQSMIGSIAGRIHGTIENCVSYATVYGTNYVGGILGTRDNALAACSVTNSQFHGTVEASGEQVGGIAGGGYSNSSAPNGVKIIVDDCTVTGSVTGKDMVGGILGADKFVAHAWNDVTFKDNAFTGKVKATDGTYVGGIIGYYLSINNKEDISGNTYSSTCGADKWIGFIKYIDTNAATHETASGALYFSTEKNTDGVPAVNGCHWRTGYNRTDDPLGADAEKLAKKIDVAVDEVVEKIDAIGTVTLESEEAIKAARAAYDALTDAQKALVTNKEALTAAETKLAELKAAAEKEAADKAAAKAVADKINAIGAVTLESEEAIKAARAAYDALTDAQKALVSNHATLTAAETKLAELKAAAEKEAADKAAAKAVADKIDAIGIVTLNSKDAISAARKAYDTLTAEQKALVANYATLTAAEKAYASLESENPPTGDNTEFMFCTAIMLVSFVGVTVFLLISKKKYGKYSN